jgi:hypothetical protein
MSFFGFFLRFSCALRHRQYDSILASNAGSGCLGLPVAARYDCCRRALPIALDCRMRSRPRAARATGSMGAATNCRSASISRSRSCSVSLASRPRPAEPIPCAWSRLLTVRTDHCSRSAACVPHHPAEDPRLGTKMGPWVTQKVTQEPRKARKYGLFYILPW